MLGALALALSHLPAPDLGGVECREIRHSAWARAFYQLQREPGKSHQQAMRALAFKWIRILFRCWQNRQPYGETIDINALRKRRSPLLKYMAEAAWQ